MIDISKLEPGQWYDGFEWYDGRQKCVTTMRWMGSVFTDGLEGRFLRHVADPRGKREYTFEPSVKGEEDYEESK